MDGTLIQIGNPFPFAGEWSITILPGAALVITLLAKNVPGHIGCGTHSTRSCADPDRLNLR
jgi:hypothetical protein